MISIIVCSVDPELVANLKANIEDTIGCTYELLIWNNLVDPKGIANVYNKLANESKGEYLCFLHEDVYIETKNWGTVLKAKADEKETGIIGFAGTRTISGFPYWYYRDSLHYFFVQRLRNGELHYDFTKDSKGTQTDFERVAVLDGMFLFCKKKVWEFNPFDDLNFQGFHLYDIDFSFAALQKYKNYVNCSIVIHHLSLGNLSWEYYKDSMRFYSKWQKRLPFSVEKDCSASLETKALIRHLVIELMEKARLNGRFTRKYLRGVGITSSYLRKLYGEYWIVRTQLKLVLFSIIKKV